MENTELYVSKNILRVIEHLFCGAMLALAGVSSVLALHEYAQQKANSHVEGDFLVLWFPFICLLSSPIMIIDGIRCIIKKNYYKGILILLLGIWCAFVWNAMSGVSCHACTYGG